ncbi:MAG TPA: AAA family ATPase, partial [Gammaproteobacteria bacterium]|nr:AAA family ATPase [Gammaproteobacteria bacterium]
MIKDDFFIEAFEPLWLTIENIGPFRESPYEIDFTDAENQPCNIFLLMSQNGRGKTTILDIMYCLMSLLGEDKPDRFGHEDLDEGRGRVQWDLRVKLDWRGEKHCVVLSLLAGSLAEEQPAMKIWSEKQLEKYGARAWHRLGFRYLALGHLERIGKSDKFVADLLGRIRAEMSSSPAGFEESTLSLPTLLYFSAYRDIEVIASMERGITEPEKWGYYPVHEITREDGTWTRSLDNLLVWLKWLDDDRFEKVIKLVNDLVFDKNKYINGIRRVPPEAIVMVNGTEKHRLDRLSSGEKSLVQMFLRIGAHMTRNTLIIIDELDVHLHSSWQHALLNLLKQLVREHPGMTVIASTHSREILEAFPIDIPETGIRKGGDIIRTDLLPMEVFKQCELGNHYRIGMIK